MARRRRKGFTLIEVLLVLVILVVLGSLATVSVFGAKKSADKKAARTQALAFGGALERYMLDIGNYPTQLGDLFSAPSEVASKWEGPYMDKSALPVDPWGNPYQYKNPGDHGAFDIWSNGPDGISGNDDDIGNW
jgi:general secretion pathway protein G